MPDLAAMSVGWDTVAKAPVNQSGNGKYDDDS